MDRVWKDVERRVYASYTTKDRTYRTWNARFFESRGKRYVAVTRDTLAFLTKSRCREVVFYEGRGEDRIKHSVAFETFYQRQGIVEHEGVLWPAMERMFLHTISDPAIRKAPAPPQPAQPSLL